MIKRIVVALDPDEDTPIAIQYAVKLAKRFDAELTGLAVVDLGNIYAGVGGGYGSEFNAMELWKELSQETRDRAVKLLDQFKQSVDKAGVGYTAIKKQGVSEDQIIEQMKYHDLLIVGRDSHFFYNQPGQKTDTLAKVVKGGAAPTMVVTDEYREIERIMIAFDGSGPAARSLKDFVHLLPYGKDLDIELVNIPESESNESKEYSVTALNGAEGYLKTHNFHYIHKHVLDKGKPAERILEHQNRKNPDMLIMGAHAVSAFQKAVFGSTTDQMITKTDIPLFLSP